MHPRSCLFAPLAEHTVNIKHTVLYGRRRSRREERGVSRTAQKRHRQRSARGKERRCEIVDATVGGKIKQCGVECKRIALIFNRFAIFCQGHGAESRRIGERIGNQPEHFAAELRRTPEGVVVFPIGERHLASAGDGPAVGVVDAGIDIRLKERKHGARSSVGLFGSHLLHPGNHPGQRVGGDERLSQPYAHQRIDHLIAVARSESRGEVARGFLLHFARIREVGGL